MGSTRIGDYLIPDLSNQEANMLVAAMHVETTGLDPQKHSVLEFSFQLTDTAQWGRGSTIYNKLISNTLGIYEGEEKALSMNNSILLELKYGSDRVVSQGEFFKNFTDWLGNHSENNGEIITLVGHGIGAFQFQFFKNIPGYKDHMDKLNFHHNFIDIGSMLVKAADEHVPSMYECAKRCHLIPTRGRPTSIQNVDRTLLMLSCLLK